MLNDIQLNKAHKGWSRNEKEVVERARKSNELKILKSDKTARWCVVSEETWQSAVAQATEGDEIENEMKQ